MAGTSFGRGFLRWGLWALMGWVFLRGVFSFLPPHTADMAAAEPAALVRAEEPAGLRAFPAMFAREYLTWQSGLEEERALRLRPYLSRSLDRQAGLTVRRDGVSQQAEGAWVYDLRQVSETRWLVTVAVQTARTQEAVVTDISGVKRPVVQRLPGAVIYLGVPVGRTAAGGWVVYDYPSLMPAPAAGEFGEPLYFGRAATDQDEKVKALLTGFFKAYTGGTAADLAYYLTPDLQIKPLQGRWTFDSIGEYTLLGGETDHWALAAVQFADPETGAVYTFRYTLGLVHSDSRWYIKRVAQTQKGE